MSEKICVTCKYIKVRTDELPCCVCDVVRHSKWEPDVSRIEVKKSCGTCIFCDGGPECESCDDKWSSWEPYPETSPATQKKEFPEIQVIRLRTLEGCNVELNALFKLGYDVKIINVQREFFWQSRTEECFTIFYTAVRNEKEN